MSAAVVRPVPGYDTTTWHTTLHAWCSRCTWRGPMHHVRTVFCGPGVVDGVAQRQRDVVATEAAAHTCDPDVLHLATAIRAQPRDPMCGELEDVIRAVLAAQVALRPATPADLLPAVHQHAETDR